MLYMYVIHIFIYRNKNILYVKSRKEVEIWWFLSQNVVRPLACAKYPVTLQTSFQLNIDPLYLHSYGLFEEQHMHCIFHKS